MLSPESLGVLRSVLIYHARPFRLRNLTDFYRQFVQPGDLVFDIGAHVGNHSLAFRRAGARVLAVEPQPRFAAFLRRWVADPPAITLAELALGKAEGRAILHISRRHPTVTSLSGEWIERVSQTASFSRVRWDRQAEVPVTTLDELIAEYGLPAFCKIDVEGHELDILHGLGTALPALSLEYLPATRESALACIDRLSTLGRYQYNWSRGEQLTLQPEWVKPGKAGEYLQSLSGADREGNLYARIST